MEIVFDAKENSLFQNTLSFALASFVTLAAILHERSHKAGGRKI